MSNSSIPWALNSSHFFWLLTDWSLHEVSSPGKFHEGILGWGEFLISRFGLFVVLATCFLSGCANGDKNPATESIEGQYIVVMKRKSSSVMNAMSALNQTHNLQNPKKIFSTVLQGGVYQLEDDQVEAVRNDPRVAYVEQDQRVRVGSVQSSAPWGLDRIDQNNLPLNQTYISPDGGAQVNVYVVDTGILTSHQDFGGRASSGFDFIDQDSDATDCNGHGTHVAGSIGGAVHGVAKNVKLIAVRVLDCEGSGSFSGVIAGIDWVTANHIKPAVANMSLGGGASQAVDDAVAASIAAGVTYAVAAGNENQNACNTSPSRVPAAITVGSSTRADQRSSFSNFGSCVDIFAPGSDILSTWMTSPSSTNTISGTSMASPHVAGVAALYLASHPQALPQEVASAILAGAVPGKISNVGTGSPNLLLSSLFGVAPENPPPVEPLPEPVAGILQNGLPVSGLESAKDGEKFFTIAVPAGATNLRTEISGGSGDADLYLRAGAKPLVSNYDCRPYLGGSRESCVVAAPVVGVYHVMVRANSAYSGLVLKASFSSAAPEPGAPCSGCQKYSGRLNAKGDFQYKPSDEYQAIAGVQQFFLKGPSNADFDLYLYKKNGSTWTQVASAVKSSSSEQISYSGTAGIYRLKVISYSGSGAFDLWLK
jgi:serine protease